MFVALLACTPDPEPLEGDDSASIETPARALWVWDTSIPGDDTPTTELLDFAAEHHVTTLIVPCDPVGNSKPGSVEAYSSFVGSAHAAGLEVLAMSSHGWFTVACGADLLGQQACWEDGWSVYEACTSSGIGFDGVMDASQPYSIAPNHWENFFPQRGRWTVRYLQGIRTRVGDLPVYHSMPAWYDDLEPFSLNDGTEELTLNAWIAFNVTATGVMSYRDDHEEVLDIASAELQNGSAWLGLEICDSGEGDSVDFHKEGAAAMIQEAEAIEAALAEEPHFLGVMLHSYACWKESGQ
ncbi:MAG TPA: hypothetical protein QGF58_26770 [Myxococcota bacterium]|nr:hypothetical protein [Myxococcota bacterium]